MLDSDKNKIMAITLNFYIIVKKFISTIIVTKLHMIMS